jgi:broad specificity phosphatase PhoE
MSTYERNQNGKFLYIRHGQTDYNLTSASIENDSTLSNSTKEEKIKNFRSDPNFLDCKLNEKGKEQSENLRLIIDNLSVKYIFCSPLRRCIETMLISLSTYKKKDELKIFIHPLLSEVVHTIHDGSIDMTEKTWFYNDLSSKLGLSIDWKYMKSLEYDYMFDFIDNDYEKVVNSCGEDGKKSLSSILKHYYQKYSSDYIPESVSAAFTRSLKLKHFLIDFEKNTQKQEGKEKILLFSHSGFIKTSTISVDYEVIDEKYPENIYFPENCEVISIDIRK